MHTDLGIFMFSSLLLWVMYKRGVFYNLNNCCSVKGNLIIILCLG